MLALIGPALACQRTTTDTVGRGMIRPPRRVADLGFCGESVVVEAPMPAVDLGASVRRGQDGHGPRRDPVDDEARPVALPAGGASDRPEPMTLLMLGAAMLGLGLSSRRWGRRVLR